MPAAQADIGIVTIDGEQVPPDLFEGHALRYEIKLCPPLSDDFTREEVVMTQLLIREGKRLGVEITGANAIGVERTNENYERLASDVSHRRRVNVRWEQQQQLADSYRNELIGDIDHATRLKRYRQAIKQGHRKAAVVEAGCAPVKD